MLVFIIGAQSDSLRLKSPSRSAHLCLFVPYLLAPPTLRAQPLRHDRLLRPLHSPLTQTSLAMTNRMRIPRPFRPGLSLNNAPDNRTNTSTPTILCNYQNNPLLSAAIPSLDAKTKCHPKTQLCPQMRTPLFPSIAMLASLDAT